MNSKLLKSKLLRKNIQSQLRQHERLVRRLKFTAKDKVRITNKCRRDRMFNGIKTIIQVGHWGYACGKPFVMYGLRINGYLTFYRSGELKSA